MYLSYFVSSHRFLFVDFFGGTWRPWVVTLPFALLWTPNRIVVFQHVSSFLAWSFLLGSTYVVLRRGWQRTLGSLFVLFIALSATVTSWNFDLMSESIALSAMVLCVGALLLYASNTGVDVVAIGVFTFGLLTLSMLRPPFLLLGLCFLGLVVLRTRHAAQSQRRRLWRSVAIVAVLFAVLGSYVLVEDNRSNYSWGRQYTGMSDLRGRTLQQTTILSLVAPWGARIVQDKIATVTHQRACLAHAYRSGQFWIGVAKRCPEGSRELAAGFEAFFLRHLLSDPVAAARNVHRPVNIALEPAPRTPERVALVPGSFERVVLSANATLILTVVTALGLIAAWKLTRRITLAVLVAFESLLAVGTVALVVLVAFSPIDTYRIAITATTMIRIGVWAGLAVLIDSALVLWRARARHAPAPVASGSAP